MPPPNDDEPQGRFLGIPYDRRRPSLRKLRGRAWNPESRRILVPKAFGWGYGVNFAEVARRLHLRRG
jgi:Family of unknown function (DUF5808)